ncbi:MAG: tRNA (adenosine(37)-N6)-threonylcarbamoyltransferase complex transferase subunit TsaD [Gallionellales bacterium RBG_16_57_15]|nr:MAG: tRNA (adenosine(37)-N6)-threonylcarbamoyltransferase complex transferase subunit TsaD [Gallionellales bacterium RBG_16_57_15]
MITLGIESSCDETGIALYQMGRGLLAHALHTQVAMHGEYGGVVPELASRDHVRRVIPLVRQVMREADVPLARINAIAYTQGPGLGGALLVGASVANALAYTLDIPAIGIHHLEGHLLSPLLSDPAPEFPFVALLVSGGHTQLMRVNGVGQYTLLGETLDDAAGEAFDKSAQLLGLGYPGGPALAKLAALGRPGLYKLPRPMLHSGDLNFSFSGLKTAVLTLVKQCSNDDQKILDEQTRADIACAVQEAIVDVLAHKARAALAQTGLDQLVVAGGVGANQLLRSRLNEDIGKRGGAVFYPDLEFCTDNGAMIAFAGALRLAQQQVNKDYRFNVKPRWDLAEISGHP